MLIEIEVDTEIDEDKFSMAEWTKVASFLSAALEVGVKKFTRLNIADDADVRVTYVGDMLDADIGDAENGDDKE